MSTFRKWLAHTTGPWWILFATLSISALLRIWLLLQPSLEWWDSAIYIGIGKYIFSGGQLGVFEIFRPFLWPLIQGSIWKVGLDPNLTGKIIVAFSSLILLGVAYKIGESMYRYAGAFAAVLIAASPAFITYSVLPITDITSALFALLAVWCALKERWFSSGLMIAIAFAFRLPHALVVVPLLLFLLTKAAYTHQWKKYIWAAVWVSLGALVIIGPYLIYAAVHYGNPLAPIQAGLQTVNALQEPDSNNIFYYIGALIHQQFLLVLAFVALFLLPWYRQLKPHSLTVVLAFCLIIIGGYFSHISHKEPRYALAFLAYAGLLSGYILARLSEKIFRSSISLIAIVGALCILIPSSYGFYVANQGVVPSFATYSRFEHFFDAYPGAHVLTSYPMIVGVSDVKIDEIFDSWENSLSAFDRWKNKSDFIMLNSCTVGCLSDTSTCAKAQATFLNSLSHQSIVFSTTTLDHCELVITQRK